MPPSLTVSPHMALFDQDVSIKIAGLSAGVRAQIRVSFTDTEGVIWASEATFSANENGAIDVAHTPSEDGTYTGVDAMGLFWSMRPQVDGQIVSTEAFLAMRRQSASKFMQLGRPALSGRQTNDIKIAVHLEAQCVAEHVYTQAYVNDDIEMRSLLDETGLAARIYIPNSHPKGGIITLTGSNGGYEEAHARLLASHGYLTMSLALFAAEGVPEHMVALPLEYVERALDWMSEQLNGQKAGMIGWSKGAETVLVAAAYLGGKVGAIASCLPCHVVMNGTDGSTNYDQHGWTWKGKALPYHLLATPAEAMQALQAIGYTPGDPLPLRAAFEAGYQRVKPDTIIPIERAACPILLLSGGDDQNWPSDYSCKVLKQRLDEAEYGHHVEWLDYPSAGHLISAPNTIRTGSVEVLHPIRKDFVLCGGSPQANAQASHDSWPKIMAFFEQSLSDQRSCR